MTLRLDRQRSDTFERQDRLSGVRQVTEKLLAERKFGAYDREKCSPIS